MLGNQQKSTKMYLIVMQKLLYWYWHDPNGYYKNKLKTYVCSFHIGMVLYVFCLMYKYNCNAFIFLSPPPNPSIILLFKKSSTMTLWVHRAMRCVLIERSSIYLIASLSSSLDKNAMFNCVVGFRDCIFFSLYFVGLYFGSSF